MNDRPQSPNSNINTPSRDHALVTAKRIGLKATTISCTTAVVVAIIQCGPEWIKTLF